MEKFLVALAWLVFSQNPLLADFDERSKDYLGLIGEIAPSRSDQQTLTINTKFDGLSGIYSKTLMGEIDFLAVIFNDDIERWTGSDILDRKANIAIPEVSHGNVQDGHEAISHHLDATNSGLRSNRGKDDTDSREKDAKSTDKANDVVQPVAFGRDTVTDAHRSSTSPLSTEVRSLNILWLFVAIAAASYGTVFAVLLLGYQRAFLTRWWYVDALICEIIGLLGLCALPGLI